MLNPLATIDWPTVVAFVLIEIAIVLLLAPLVIQRKNEERAVVVFKEKLLPLLPTPPSTDELVARVRQAVADLLPTPPSTEQQALARDELGAAIGAVVQAQMAELVPQLRAVIDEAVKANVSSAAKTMSAAGVDARTLKAAREEEFLQAVAQHPKGGLLAVAALEKFKELAPKTYDLAVRAGVDHVPAFLDKHGDKLRLGFGSNSAPAAQSRVLRA